MPSRCAARIVAAAPAGERRRREMRTKRRAGPFRPGEPRGTSPAGRNVEENPLFKFLGSVVGIIFLIGLLVIIGLLALIF